MLKVLYGGRWQEGSGMTLGEEAEQVFAYLSRYNSTTKNMLKAGICLYGSSDQVFYYFTCPVISIMRFVFSIQ